MQRVITQKFFDQPVLKVAKGLLGKYLVRKVGKKNIYAKVVEVEAYDGQKDLACHASKGKTERNCVMFGEAGHFYVYFVYGMHFMLNVVTSKKGYPAAVLIRGVEVEGKKLNGPAKLTKFLKISKKLNGKKAEPESGLWFEDNKNASRAITFPRVLTRKRAPTPTRKSNNPLRGRITATPRIGVAYAGPVWSQKPWRFILDK